MIYILYGATLAFGWFVCVNVVLSLTAAALAPWASRATRAADPAMRARILLALRLVPSFAALAFAIAIFVPSFIRYEPRDFDEAFGVTTTSLAVLASLALLAAVWRGAAAMHDVRRRTTVWLRGARPIELACAVPAYSVDSAAAAMTLVGVFKPRLLVTRPLLDVLSQEELAAAVQHEHSHLRSHDNLKRLAIRSAPDVLAWSRSARKLEHEWSAAAEHAADDCAARDRAVGVALASALVKAARVAATPVQTALVSPLIGGEQLRARVQRLLDPPSARPARSRLVPVAIVAVAATLLLGYGSALAGVHEITETVVHLLP